ncbi:MAG: hypothetical protein KC620_17640 [Myxococcales bacterium]|nr:hypothetical protein [Myxococcales bacterium]
MSEQKPQVDDLFGDEDLGLDAAPPPREAAPRRLPMRLILAVVAIIAVALFWYLSSAHHEKFYIRVDGDVVHVERGYYFPVGSGSWMPNRAYEAFKLPPGISPERTGAMSAEEVDATLHRLFVTIAQRELNNLESGNADVAEDMLMRAQKLRSTSIADDRKLLQMLGDVAFRRGLKEVRGIQSRFDEALAQFQIAAMRGGEMYPGAQKWVDAISRLRAEFRRLAVDSGLDPDLILNEPPVLPALDKLLPGDAPAEGEPAPAPPAEGK